MPCRDWCGSSCRMHARLCRSVRKVIDSTTEAISGGKEDDIDVECECSEGDVGAPRAELLLQVHVTVLVGTLLARARKGAPEICRHVLQWQKVALVTGLVIDQQMRPQLQEPVRGFLGVGWVGVEFITMPLLEGCFA